MTTCSASMSPLSVRTPTARPFAVRICSTRVSSRIRVPRSRAPRASAIVVSTGLTRPSRGNQKAASVVEKSPMGNSSAASAGETSCTSMPMRFMKADARRHSSTRSVGVGRLDVAHLAPAGGLTGSRLEVCDQVASVGVEIARPLVTEQAWHDLSRGVPGGPRRQLVAFDHHDVGPAEEVEVIGDIAADRAAADDDDLGPGGSVAAHGSASVARVACDAHPRLGWLLPRTDRPLCIAAPRTETC